jgi:hypothetical protein
MAGRGGKRNGGGKGRKGPFGSTRGNEGGSGGELERGRNRLFRGIRFHFGAHEGGSLGDEGRGGGIVGEEGREGDPSRGVRGEGDRGGSGEANNVFVAVERVLGESVEDKLLLKRFYNLKFAEGVRHVRVRVRVGGRKGRDR